MTLTMYDSIFPAQLPPGADAYLGYVNGEWVTYGTLKAQFPGAHILGLSVGGPSTLADGVDVENGDYTQAQGAQWVVQALAAGAPTRPVWYESASQMNGAISALAAAGVTRGSVRLISAHYGAGEHICGPGSCGLVAVDADGTQWTDQAQGVGGAQIDQSALSDSFFEGNDPMAVSLYPGKPADWADKTDVTTWSNPDGSLFAAGVSQTDGYAYTNFAPPAGQWAGWVKAA